MLFKKINYTSGTASKTVFDSTARVEMFCKVQADSKLGGFCIKT